MIWCLIHDCDYNDCDCALYALCEDCNRYVITDDDRDYHQDHTIKEPKDNT